MILEFIDSPDSFPGKDRSWVTLSVSITSPSSFIVAWFASPCGAASAFGIFKAWSICSGIDHPLSTSFSIDLANASAFCPLADVWLLLARAAFRSAMRVSSGRG